MNRDVGVGVLPAEHLLRAALRAGQLIDELGSSVERARTSYSLYASDALYPPSDLRSGEELLLAVGLLIDDAGTLHLTEQLRQLTRLDSPSEAICGIVDRVVDRAMREDGPWSSSLERLEHFIAEQVVDPGRREARLLDLATKYDNAALMLVGAAGEEYVAQLAEAQLRDIGRFDLADQVRRVSLISDSLGYDLVVPRPDGRLRIEVKTSSIDDPEVFRFTISRNEAEWGLKDADWRMVACIFRDGNVDVVGHCRAARILKYLPTDSEGGRWRDVQVMFPRLALEQGMPSLL